jgi:hypothetical protein
VALARAFLTVLSQAAWDREHKAIEEGHAGAVGKIVALRKLGQRPQLVL